MNLTASVSDEHRFAPYTILGSIKETGLTVCFIVCSLALFAVDRIRGKQIARHVEVEAITGIRIDDAVVDHRSAAADRSAVRHTATQGRDRRSRVRLP